MEKAHRTNRNEHTVKIEYLSLVHLELHIHRYINKYVYMMIAVMSIFDDAPITKDIL